MTKDKSQPRLITTEDNDLQASESDIRQQAADWLLILEADDAELERQQFAAWLHKSAEHQRIWQQTVKAWQLVGQLEQKPTAVNNTEIKVNKRSRPLVWLASVAAACMLVVVWPWMLLHWQADAVTGIGETQILTLDDGSQVHLGADSALAVNFSPEQRNVTLLQGQAFFQVSHDRQRPFVVSTEQVQVEVLGTEFDVETGSVNSHVGVASGLVSVANQSQQQRLRPGQLVAAAEQGDLDVRPTMPDQVAPWREQRLFVQGRTVADVIESLQRYYPGKIIVFNKELKNKRVTGSYQLQKIDHALAALILPYDAKVIHLGPFLRIIT